MSFEQMLKEVIINSTEDQKNSIFRELKEGGGKITLGRILTMWKWLKKDQFKDQARLEQAFIKLETANEKSKQLDELEEEAGSEEEPANDDHTVTFYSAMEEPAMS